MPHEIARDAFRKSSRCQVKSRRGEQASGCLQPMEWIRQNRESYRGQFVALNEGQLVACGAKEREVWEAAKQAGVSAPFLAYIETAAEEIFGGW